MTAPFPASHPFAPQAVLAIVNPVSGNPATRQRGRRLAQLLKSRGYEVATTQRRGHGTELAREAAHAGKTGIIVVGGDGTLCEIIAELPPETALAYFPAGSGNNFAFNLSLPQEPGPWLGLMEKGAMRAMRFGLCNRRPFASVASVGYDALLVRNTPMALKRRLNKGAYIVEFIANYLAYNPPRFQVKVDGKPLGDHVLGVIVGRGANYGGPHPILPACNPGEGKLSYLIMEGHSKALIWKFAVGVVRNSLPRMAGVTCGSAHTVEVETQPASYVQVDGDLYGTNPVTFSVESVTRHILAP